MINLENYKLIDTRNVPDEALELWYGKSIIPVIRALEGCEISINDDLFFQISPSGKTCYKKSYKKISFYKNKEHIMQYHFYDNSLRVQYSLFYNVDNFALEKFLGYPISFTTLI